MATTTHNLSNHIKNRSSFANWLHNTHPALFQLASEVLPPEQAEVWIELLQATAEQKHVHSIFSRCALPPETIAQLFERMATLLPEKSYTIWRQFAAAQVQIMSLAKDTPLPPSIQHQRIGALSHLAKQTVQLTDRDQYLQEVASVLADTFFEASVNIFLIISSSTTLNLAAGVWPQASLSAAEKAAFAKTISLTQNIVTIAIETGAPQVAQSRAYPLPPEMPDVYEELAAPLIKQEQTLGAIHILSHTDKRFTLNDLSFLEAIASQTAVMLNNSDLQSTIHRQTREKQILLETNTALGSSLDTDRMLELLAQKIAEALHAGACIVSRWNEAERTLTAIAEHVHPHKDNPPRTWRDLNKPIRIQNDSIGRQVLQTLRPIALQTTSTRPQNSAQKPLEWTQYGWQSVLAFPLTNKQKKLGLIEVYDRDPDRFFTVEDIQMGKALASQAGIAITQTEYLQQMQQRLIEVSTLYTLSRQIISTSPLHLQELLENIVNTMRQIVNCRACVLFLVDDTQQFLEIKAAAGLKKHWEKTARLAVGEGAAGQAVAEKTSIYIPDTTQDPNFIFFDHAVRSLLVVPMIYQGKVVGTINLDDTRPQAFGKSQERLLTIAANQAAIAIQNATLFNKVLSEEQRTRAIIQHMADGTILLNRGGNIITVNPALARMLGMHPAEIIGKNVHKERLDPRLEMICKPLTQRRQTGILTNEVTLPGKNAPTLRIFATTVTDENKQPVGEVRVVHDVTQERILERMKDDFISTISHELRTPLFSIQGFVRLMLNGDVPDPQTQREFLSIIERQADHLSDLVSNLLDLNRLSTNAMQLDKHPVQMAAIISQTILKLQGFSHKKKVRVYNKLPANLPPVLGDAQRLEQIITNLLGNAIKFTPVGGKVVVEAKHQQQDVIFSITDTGIGIAPEELDRIFGKFYQVEEHNTRSAEGSGLGLHIAKQLVEKHNGQIWAKSQLGKGSTFYVKLPAATQNIPRQ